MVYAMCMVDVRIVCGAVDPTLDKHNRVFPGVGDFYERYLNAVKMHVQSPYDGARGHIPAHAVPEFRL